MAKILTTDDSAFMRKILSDILVKNNYTVVEAENGKQAIEVFNAEKPDLVLLDIIMPEMGGLSVIKQIAPKGAKVIVISAVGQDDMIGQAKEAGALDYIVKPFEESAVLSTISKVLGSSATSSSQPSVQQPNNSQGTPSTTDQTQSQSPVQNPATVPVSSVSSVPAPESNQPVQEKPVEAQSTQTPAPATPQQPINNQLSGNVGNSQPGQVQAPTQGDVPPSNSAGPTPPTSG